MDMVVVSFALVNDWLETQDAQTWAATAINESHLHLLRSLFTGKRDRDRGPQPSESITGKFMLEACCLACSK